MAEKETAPQSAPAKPRSPWPKGSAGDRPVLFLCDTRTRLERRLLTDWVTSTKPRTARRPVFLHLDLDREASHRFSGTRRDLSTALDGPAETMVVPLRVGWPLQSDLRDARPRVRDLFVSETVRTRDPFATWLRQQDPRRASQLAGAPATIGEMRQEYDQYSGGGQAGGFVDFVIRQAAITLDVTERDLKGRRYKVPRGVIAGIESRSEYLARTMRLAKQTTRPVEEIRADVNRYLREMVATPERFFIDGMGAIARWITSLGYQGIVTDPENVERARTVMRDHPSALLWTHKSHVDGIALLSVMYENDFPAPHTFGGINMAFPGVGYTGRRSGTIYIRRSFSDNPVYKLALQEYLGFLMAKRFPLSWAFEGTRSRNGKLGRPRYGLLKYVMDAAHGTRTEDLHLIPVSINYDLISETGEYALEETGMAKEVESLGWFMQYLRRLQTPKGNIYLEFGEPIVLQGPAPEPDRATLHHIANEVGLEANRLIPVTLTALMCIALLGAAPRALTYDELHRAMITLLDWLREHGARLTTELDTLDTPSLQQLAENVFAGGVVQRVTEGSEVLFEIEKDQYSVATYYSNTIAHYFIDKAIGEIALATAADLPAPEREEAFWAEVDRLRSLTAQEFYHTSRDRLPEVMARQLAVDTTWSSIFTGTDADVFLRLRTSGPVVAHAVLLPIFEAYWVTAKVVADWNPEKPISAADVVTRSLRRASTALRRRRITNPASISAAMFKGAYAYLEANAMVPPEQDPGDTTGRDALDALISWLEGSMRHATQISGMAASMLFTPEEPGGSNHPPAQA